MERKRWWWNALGRRVLFALRGNARLQPETRSIGADEDSRAPLSIRGLNFTPAVIPGYARIDLGVFHDHSREYMPSTYFLRGLHSAPSNLGQSAVASEVTCQVWVVTARDSEYDRLVQVCSRGCQWHL